MEESAEQFERMSKTPTQVNRLKTTHKHNGVGRQHSEGHPKVTEDLNEKRSKRKRKAKLVLLYKKTKLHLC